MEKQEPQKRQSISRTSIYLSSPKAIYGYGRKTDDKGSKNAKQKEDERSK
ncbi:MAG: hypothetical protein J6K39_02785 [Clostridia bacterium]|nr:hypothetical protein [Clostridia bacterium]